jgi:hypothetical protein
MAAAMLEIMDIHHILCVKMTITFVRKEQNVESAKLHNVKLHKLFPSPCYFPDKAKEDRMGRACSTDRRAGY